MKVVTAFWFECTSVAWIEFCWKDIDGIGSKLLLSLSLTAGLLKIVESTFELWDNGDLDEANEDATGSYVFGWKCKVMILAVNSVCLDNSVACMHVECICKTLDFAQKSKLSLTSALKFDFWLPKFQRLLRREQNENTKSGSTSLSFEHPGIKWTLFLNHQQRLHWLSAYLSLH